MTRAVLPILAAMTLLQACASGGCLDNQNALPLAGFYSTEGGEALTVSGLAIGAVGAPDDSLLCHPETQLSEVYLPFRPEAGSTEFLFKVGDIADLVTFHYTSEPYFVSEECGVSFRYRITAVDHRGLLLDSVAVTDSLVTNVEMQRIRLYLTPPEPEPDEPENPDEPETTPEE